MSAAVVCLAGDPGVAALGETLRYDGGAAAAINRAATDTGRADLALVVAPIAALTPGALDRLGAATADTTVATASALRATDPELVPAAAVRPVITTPVPGLTLVTRAALDLVLPLDEAATDPAAALAALGAACSARGLVHVLADDVIAAGDGPAPSAAAPRHALDRVLAAADARRRRLTVTIDGRAIGPYRAGTQVHALELIAALARTDAADLRVVVAHDLAEDARALFDADPRITTITYEQAAHDAPGPTDIVHRPSQVFSPADLALLRPLGRQLVVTHQDLITYRSPGFADDQEQWERLRLAARISLAAAARVVFFSAAARDDALRDDLVAPERAAVVGIGVDHHVTGAAEPAAPAGFEPGAPYLLMLGAGLPHKNLPFARALLDELRAGGWDGRLLVAGPGHEPGPGVFGQVSEPEKAYLLAHAAAVVYPTLYEGFGLIPFEAAAAAVPCAFAAVSALGEIMPAELAVLAPWDPNASAAGLRPLLEPGPAREAHVAGLREVAARHTWDAAAAQLLTVYRDALADRSPESEATRLDALDVAARLDALGHRYGVLEREFLDFQEQIGPDGLGLVGPHGILDAADRRALLAVATRPALRRPFLAFIRAGYRAARRLGR